MGKEEIVGFDPRDLERFSRLDLVARGLVEGFISGLHRSPYKGSSVEFAEHRQYTYGDEIRHIDWHAYGKTDRFFVKEFEEETNLRAHLIVDASGSMAYAGGGISKFRYGIILAAALAYLLVRQRDAVGLGIFDSRVREYIPPKSSPEHFRMITDRLEACEPGGETALGPILHELAERIRRRGMIILLSDLFDDPEAIIRALQHFRYKKHDVILLHVLCRDEIDFPFRRLSQFVSLEREELRITLDPPAIRAEYLRRFRAFLERLESGTRELEIDGLELVTDTPYDQALGRFLFARAALQRRRKGH